MMAFLLADPQDGAEHHMARDREPVYVFSSLYLSIYKATSIQLLRLHPDDLISV